jgi:hypothetical protein
MNRATPDSGSWGSGYYYDYSTSAGQELEEDGAEEYDENDENDYEYGESDDESVPLWRGEVVFARCHDPNCQTGRVIMASYWLTRRSNQW